jgi:hypothetical protein
MEVALEFFILRVRKSRKTTLLKLDDFDGAGTALLDVVAKAFAPLIKGNYKGVLGKSLGIIGLKKSPVGIEGTLVVGEYGLASSVIDVNDGSKAFDKDKHHAEQVPYYFRVHIPKGGDQGVLILQRLGVGGITSIVKPIIRDYFGSKFDKHTLDIAPMVPDFVFKRYLTKGTPKSVTFVKNSIPADYADRVAGKRKEMKGSVEVTIKSSEGSFFRPQKLAEAASVGKIASVYTFDEFEPDQVKMKIDVGGKTRTINLNNQANLRASFDVTEKVNEDKSGYPNKKDVSAAAQEILVEVAAAAGVKL